MTFFPREELGSSAPQGGNHEEEAPPRWFDPYLALGIKGKGGFGEFRAWDGMSSGRVRERAGANK